MTSLGDNKSDIKDSKLPQEDCVYNYACSVLSLGMVFKEFQDAIREGDGDREERIWKILLLLFKAKVKNKGSRTKYAFESFKYLALLNSLLTPRMAHKLKWSKYINTSGGHGKNIPCDLRVEHEVRQMKGLFSAIGGNLDQKNAARAVKAHNNLEKIVHKFDKDNKVPPQSTSHKKLSSDHDIDIMVSDLLRGRVFTYIGNREHKAFPDHQRSPINDLDMSKVLKWIKRLVRQFSKGYQALDDLEEEEEEENEEDV